jgi:hypothetical protein
MKAQVLVICFFMPLHSLTVQEAQCPLAPNKTSESCLVDKAKKIASVGAAFWATMLTTNLAHELGHAVVGKAVLPRHNTEITLHLNPFRGAFLDLTGMSTRPSGMALISTIAAGPIVGLASNYLALRLAVARQEKKKGITYTEAWRTSSQKPILNKDQNLGLQTAALFSGIVNVFNLIPKSAGDDGYKILEVMGKSHMIGQRGLLFNALTSGALMSYAGYGLYKLRTAPDESISDIKKRTE